MSILKIDIKKNSVLIIFNRYADIETECRVYHVCVEERKESFFCGDGTVFNQKILTCDYPKDTDCAGSQRYWSANEELGKPGAEPGPGQNQIPVSPAKTRQPFRQSKGKFRQQKTFPQQPVQQYQPQPQVPQKTYDSYAAEDNGFVAEPVKKLRPSYKVVKTQQQVNYPTDYRGFNPSRVRVSPAKAKFFQTAIPVEVAGPNPVDQNYKQPSYQQSDSYFSQQQTSGEGWQPSSGPISQQPQQQSQQITNQEQSYYSGQQERSPQKSYRQSFGQQQQYSQPSNTPNGWRTTSGEYSQSDLSGKSVDVNIPQTNFDCEGKPYEPGKYFEN